jgi:hypothetical protein
MDMMRPVSIVLPPKQPDGLATSIVSIAKNGKSGVVKVSWNDNSVADTAYVVQRMNGTGSWVDLTTIQVPLTQQPNYTGPMFYNDTTWLPAGVYQYRVIARNTVGYGGQFPSMTAESMSGIVAGPIPDPTGLTATLQAGPRISLSWTDNALNESGFVIQRAVNGGAFAAIATPGPKSNTGTVTYVDTGILPATSYQYRVAAVNAAGQSGWATSTTVNVPALPGQPTITTATAARQGNGERVTVNWPPAVSGATGYIVQWSSTDAFTTIAGQGTVGNVTTFTTGTIARQVWYVRVIATNLGGQSPPSTSWQVAAA